ncbi:putative dehydrogenase [Endobacter medicaginis]|uniref:Gfo/Idh/MocA family oxidoreductase n=1 Tax=Endobacter medicaginis TaxID=1181271 RepID=A0A850NNY5_9PROT|nr:Gfo/Idh/MocA family oxidoreductase [Endobacter medicaginis]MBB3174521.1 putative dehydrogenase [Endobacter medicaginis]MCX5476463.1 Gfo/Idh/MocA family oxidoreductase [Endobacter medicaginis]NVN29750.1 Gfo/Idh/MocA family oxidoreductase [Endobacter medicaginis]
MSIATLSSPGTIGVGLVGSGFMGRAHAQAFRAVGGLFDLPLRPRLSMLADTTMDGATRAAASLGFEHACDDWRELVADPNVDLVAITTPNALHAPIALAALAAGKHVYCEKPLSVTLDEATRMCAAARAAGTVTAVGFNYLANPMLQVAREIVASGEIGEITFYRGIHAEDFMADPAAPFSWRCRPDQAGGALADIGSHALSMARFLLGDVERVFASLDTIHHRRPDPARPGTMLPVTIDDSAHMLLRFHDRPLTAHVCTTWLASGRDMQLGFEIAGTRGGLSFSQERFNELRLYRAGEAPGRSGFRTLHAGPAHGDYGAFCPAPGHQIGFGDLKTIEVARLLGAIAGHGTPIVDFDSAAMIAALSDAARRSSLEERWISLPRDAPAAAAAYASPANSEVDR